MLRGLFVLLIFAVIVSCKTEVVFPVRPAIIVYEIDLELPPEEAAYTFDLDSNGFTDYTLLVHELSGEYNTKLILRMQGAISTPFTSSIHADLRELSEIEQCNITYESILEPTIFNSGDTIGNNLELKWYFSGDFHHSQMCRGDACACNSDESDVIYVPIAPGETGYVGLRFIIRQRKHFGWLEIERSVDGTSYRISRTAYNRFFGKPIAVP